MPVETQFPLAIEQVALCQRNDIRLIQGDLSIGRVQCVSHRSDGVGVESGNVTVSSCTIHDCKNHGVLYVGSSATGRVERCVVENCKLNGLLLRDGASPVLSNTLLKGNGQYGAALIDCRAQYLANDEKGNAKGAVKGECDDDDVGDDP